MTTGVLLRRLQIEGDLNGISHVFVDEVHERDINTDFLLIVLKTVMRKRPDLRVVLMSATLNAELFSNYFAEFGCTLLNIPGRAYPVTTYYLEDAMQQTGYRVAATSMYAFKDKRGGSAKGGNKRGERPDDVDREKRGVMREKMIRLQAISSKYKPEVMQVSD